ncbi:MAG: SPOR domain-containing protein [Bacteroidales bacterium]|nr:SPOR domain-containing protein [Bacteroidales bacterium]
MMKYKLLIIIILFSFININGQIIVHKNDILDDLVAKHTRLTAKPNSFFGYTIQLGAFSGNYSKSKAEALMYEVINNISNIPVNIVFDSPYYKVMAGAYIDKYEARYDYEYIRKTYPQAIIVPYFINVKNLIIK